MVIGDSSATVHRHSFRRPFRPKADAVTLSADRSNISPIGVICGEMEAQGRRLVAAQKTNRAHPLDGLTVVSFEQAVALVWALARGPDRSLPSLGSLARSRAMARAAPARTGRRTTCRCGPKPVCWRSPRQPSSASHQARATRPPNHALRDASPRTSVPGAPAKTPAKTRMLAICLHGDTPTRKTSP